MFNFEWRSSVDNDKEGNNVPLTVWFHVRDRFNTKLPVEGKDMTLVWSEIARHVRQTWALTHDKELAAQAGMEFVDRLETQHDDVKGSAAAGGCESGG